KVTDAASVDLQSDTDVGWGFNVGMLAKISDTLSAGVQYRHKVKNEYAGTATFTQLPTGNAQVDARLTALLPQGAQPISTSIEFPALFSGGVAWTTGDWTVEGDIDWYQWSTFNQLTILFTSRPDLNQAIPENYKNSWQYRIGLERRLNQTWAL